MRNRNANLDVFRCLAMFLVVLGHVWQHGGAFDKTPTNEMLICGGLRWHVDAFLALSGWFVMITGALVFFVCRHGASEALMQRVSYLAPHVIAMAVAMLVLFDRFVKCPNWLGRLCVRLAPSMFGIYLLHEPSCFGRIFHRVPLQFLVERGFSPELAILIAAVACFVICFLLDLVRRYSLRGIMRFRGFEVEWLKRWA